MSYSIEEIRAPYYIDGNYGVETYIMAVWDHETGTWPTPEQVYDVVATMKKNFPGREKEFRLTGFPVYGDHLYGVEVN